MREIANSRQETIIELLREEGQVSVNKLARRFDVSEMTIRRDLDQLERQGVLLRTYGGGISTGKLRFMQSALPHYAASSAKVAIGKAAAGLIKPGQTIMVDSGTTTLEAVRHLPQNIGITLVTVSLCVAQELYGSDVNVLLLGGTLRKEFPSTYGPITENLLNSFRIDTLLISCDAADSENGFYVSEVGQSSLIQAMVRVADQVVVLAESKKFDKKSFMRYASPREISDLITDEGLSVRDRTNLEGQGVKVLIAQTNQS